MQMEGKEDGYLVAVTLTVHDGRSLSLPLAVALCVCACCDGLLAGDGVFLSGSYPDRGGDGICDSLSVASASAIRGVVDIQPGEGRATSGQEAAREPTQLPPARTTQDRRLPPLLPSSSSFFLPLTLHVHVRIDRCRLDRVGS